MTKIINAPPRVMVGASAGVAGRSGYVTTPGAGDQDKVLHGDGTWRTPGTGSGGGGGSVLDVAGLTGGDGNLDGLDTGELASRANGSIVELFFTGSKFARYVIRDREEGDEEVAGNAGDADDPGGSLIFCDNDEDRCWELVSVHKNGLPCVWNGETLKWHQQLGTGTGDGVSNTLAQEADAFSLPA
jgi:hypothetical protein